MVMQSIIALEWHHRNVGHGVTLTALDATMINFSRYKSCFPIFLGYGFLQENKKHTRRLSSPRDICDQIYSTTWVESNHAGLPDYPNQKRGR